MKKVYLETPVECCRCRRMIVSVMPVCPGLKPHHGSVMTCHCGAVLMLCTAHEHHTHLVGVMTPDGIRAATVEEALAATAPANASMN